MNGRRWPTEGRRARASLAALLVAGSLLALPAAVSAQGGACQDGTQNSTWSGGYKDPAGGQTTWVSAIKDSIYIPSSSHFFACSLNSPGNDGPSNWVAIEPGSGSNQYSNGNAILQIGVTRCTSIAYAACSNSVPHFWWSRGGCSGYLPVPFDLGQTSWSSTHAYEIDQSGGNFVLKIDGLNKVSISKTAAPITCWTNQDTRADWAAERFDRGDSTGSNGATSQRSQFTGLRYATYANNVWVSPSLSSCYNTYPSGAGRYVCAYGSDLVHVWTLNP